MGISQIQFVKHIGWYYARLNEIINGKRGVSADSALALFEALDTHPEFWLNLSRNWDLWQAKKTYIHVRFLKKVSQAIDFQIIILMSGYMFAQSELCRESK